ncbi:MAG: hypothetical protein ACLP9L_13385 [Thermoguttaceae bacterium]
MRKALLVYAIVLLGGSFVPCSGEDNVPLSVDDNLTLLGDDKTLPPAKGKALHPEKDKADRFRKRIDGLLKLPPKTSLSAAQMLAYHRLREFAEPKLIDILTGLNGKTSRERLQAKGDLKVAQEQFKEDLNVILTGFPPGPDLPPVAQAVANQDKSDSSIGQPVDKDSDDAKLDLFLDLLHRDNRLSAWDNGLSARKDALKKRLSVVEEEMENGQGDRVKLRGEANSLERVIDVYASTKQSLEQNLQGLRQSEMDLAEDLGVLLFFWAQADRGGSATSIDEIAPANRNPSPTDGNATKRKSGAWARFGMAESVASSPNRRNRSGDAKRPDMTLSLDELKRRGNQPGTDKQGGDTQAVWDPPIRFVDAGRIKDNKTDDKKDDKGDKDDKKHGKQP